MAAGTRREAGTSAEIPEQRPTQLASDPIRPALMNARGPAVRVSGVVVGAPFHLVSW
jgi:hypothetical protein